MQVKSLQPLVGDRVYQGVTRRPVFVGGQATMDIIRAMTLNQRFADRHTVTAEAEWGLANIPHDPSVRQRCAQQYMDWKVGRERELRSG